MTLIHKILPSVYEVNYGVSSEHKNLEHTHIDICKQKRAQTENHEIEENLKYRHNSSI